MPGNIYVTAGMEIMGMLMTALFKFMQQNSELTTEQIRVAFLKMLEEFEAHNPNNLPEV